MIPHEFLLNAVGDAKRVTIRSAARSRAAVKTITIIISSLR
jgi:hypothetical protein